jgi:hypothetical protein
MRNTIGTVGRKLMLGTALVVGLLGTGVVANAAPQNFHGGYRGGERHEFVPAQRPVIHDGFRAGYGYRDGFRVGVGIGYPVADAYIPPCPGDGYEWNAGYYNGGVWFPGAWRLRAGFYGRGYVAGPVARFDRGRGYERGFDRGYRGRR